MMPATSSATAVKTWPGSAPCATSVATRRRAACSVASRERASRDSALAMEVASSSVNSTIRDSVSAGRGLLWFVAAIIVPQSRPSTTIGEATAERTPSTFAMRRDRTGCALPVIHPGGLSRSMHRGDDVLTLERETGAQRGRVPRRLRLRDERGGLVGLETKHPDGVHLQDPSRLFGDRFEDLNRR